ncbi:MAG: methylated-DNA--[protein]-cysteine S-methyltransferase [Acidobacteria bacterium]|nr:methylated-DNA--[protein]-cysteine S-methyltransferase [Acidobacteriota bacterium]
MTLYTETIETPIGPLRLVGREDALQELLFDPNAPVEAQERPGFGGFADLLRAYFGGDLGAIDRIAVDAAGTAFQKQVWRLLREIPTGRTTSYGELAARLGKPAASRAVGLANARNPVAVVVPCHRVIGAGGHLTGYAGGLERKRWLLRHEGALLL